MESLNSYISDGESDSSTNMVTRKKSGTDLEEADADCEPIKMEMSEDSSTSDERSEEEEKNNHKTNSKSAPAPATKRHYSRSLSPSPPTSSTSPSYSSSPDRKKKSSEPERTRRRSPSERSKDKRYDDKKRDDRDRKESSRTYRREDDRDRRHRDDRKDRYRDRDKDSDRHRRYERKRSRRSRTRSKSRSYDKHRDSRSRKHRSRSRSRSRSYDRHRRRSSPRRSHHKHKSPYRSKRSRSRSRTRSRSKSRSKEKVPPKPVLDWKSSSKLKVLEKLGIELKVPASGIDISQTGIVSTAATTHLTPQLLLQKTMEEQVEKVKTATGIELPSYYNPIAVNPSKYAEQIQKRRLLWGNKDKQNKIEEENGTTYTQPSTTMTTIETKSNSKMWQGATFGGDQDGKMTAKFQRLMGIKNANPDVGNNSDASSKPAGGSDLIKKQEEMFHSMESQYEVARLATHSHRGLGLGFGTFQPR